MSSFPPNQRSNNKAIAWAIFSQAVWLPVFMVDTGEWIVASSKDYEFESIARIPYQINPLSGISPNQSRNNPTISDTSATTSIQHTNAGIVLNDGNTTELLVHTENHRALSSSPVIFSSPPSQHQFVPSMANTSLLAISTTRIGTSERSTSSITIDKLYTRSELLGGPLTLGDINEAEMPPIARAERAQWKRSGDPLAAIPQFWRESMRKALNDLSTGFRPQSKKISDQTEAKLAINPAQIIHVPSTRVKRVSEVPLALQSDGTVDILNTPEDPGVVDEIKTWSSKQQLPSPGHMTPAVVHLHPLPVANKTTVNENVTLRTEPSAPTYEVPQKAAERSAPDHSSQVHSGPPTTPEPTTAAPPPLQEASSHVDFVTPVEASSVLQQPVGEVVTKSEITP